VLVYDRRMDLGLAGRVYLCTGSSRGLGFATAKYLVADGANVLVSSRDKANVDDAVATLNAGQPGERATGVTADLGDPSTPQALVSAAIARFGRLDGALISVGGPPRGTALSATDEQWLSAFSTVFLGAVRCARVVSEHLVSGGSGDGGSIGFVLSTSVRVPIPGLGISNGLRPGLAGVIKDMADELGPRGIRVVGLVPGRFETDRNRELFDAAADPAAARAEAAATIPARRLGDPDEFGRVAAFLLSPAASYVSGSSIPIDGGVSRAI
jgi:3-oxoacyl-[acyl-carrier protein] reductase